MKLATLKINGSETACVMAGQGLVTIESIIRKNHKPWSTALFDIIQSGQLEEIRRWYLEQDEDWMNEYDPIPIEQAQFGPLYRHPRKIWGIGHNYVEASAELSRIPADSEPVGFMKPDTSIIGPLDAIRLPRQSKRVTAEAELGIIIGKECRNLTIDEAPSAIAGYTTVIDVTADDIHQKNPRFLTRAKSFDTFFSFGPILLTPDEIKDISEVFVSTVLNRQVSHRNAVANMRYHPWQIVSFHSAFMTLLPGDILSTGTPGAVVIRDGDTVECRIDGFEALANPVLNMH